MPNSNLASSLIKSCVHGGSKVISTSASLTALSDFTFSSTSKGKVSATGQLGVVNVKDIALLTENDKIKLSELRGWSIKLVNKIVKNAIETSQRTK